MRVKPLQAWHNNQSAPQGDFDPHSRCDVEIVACPRLCDPEPLSTGTDSETMDGSKPATSRSCRRRGAAPAPNPTSTANRRDVPDTGRADAPRCSPALAQGDVRGDLAPGVAGSGHPPKRKTMPGFLAVARKRSSGQQRSNPRTDSPGSRISPPHPFRGSAQRGRGRRNRRADMQRCADPGRRGTRPAARAPAARSYSPNFHKTGKFMDGNNPMRGGPWLIPPIRPMRLNPRG